MDKMDRFMLSVLERLATDLTKNVTFQGTLFQEFLSVVKRAKATGSVQELRTFPWPAPPTSDPYFLKVCIQLRDFLKRYIFVSDLYTDRELDKLTDDKFLAVQESVSRHKPVKLTTYVVCQLARKLNRQILGVYDDALVMDNCRFSTKACKGFPVRRAHLFEKLKGPITGSRYEIEWFQRNYLPTDPLLASILEDQKVVFEEVESLDLFNVPKSYKIKRGISPNTLIGSFRTYGIGKVLEEKIRLGCNIDLARQPSWHKVLAKKSSKTRRLVTADLASASHCFTSPIINRLLPRDWFNALNRYRVRHVTLNREGDQDKRVVRDFYQESFMAMGIGFTFPLQTLLFWSLLRSIQTLTRIKGHISVFGDDLIYPREMHPIVVSVLSDLGFSMNLEKTFVQEFFRESCGGDFCRGIEVRPAMPEAEHAEGQVRFSIEAIKVANSLSLRWTHHEIPSTLLLIQRAVGASLGWIPFVPDDLPDYAGFKRVEGSLDKFLVAPPSFDSALHSFVFPCLLMSPTLDYIPVSIGYYWDKLRAMEQGEIDTASISDCKDLSERVSTVPSLYGSVRDLLTWKTKRPKSVKRPSNYRSNLTKRRLKMTWPYVANKVGKATIRVHMAISIIAS